MNIVIVTPVYNDWSAFRQLLEDLANVLPDQQYRVLAINDDSEQPPPADIAQHPCEVLHLTCNLGHQRAIAIGLAYIADQWEFDVAVVMDSDGEDRPDYIPQLLEMSAQSPQAIIAARRDKRSEGAAFRFGYRIYQGLFRLFTGKRIPFGNFCLFPREVVKRLVFQESIWNHLAATVLRSRFDLRMLSTERGKRYAGDSSMNFGSLVLLGISAISVYSDIALLRTLIGSFFFSCIALVGIFTSTSIKLFTSQATPGWASTVVGSMSIILIQALVLSVFLLFFVQSQRSQRGFVVARHYQDYVLRVDQQSA